MNISYYDTEEVNNISNNLLSLTNDLEAEINKLFSRLHDVPTITGEWVGNESDYYFNKVNEDKVQYIDFINRLRIMINTLNKGNTEVSDCINNNIKSEMEKN